MPSDMVWQTPVVCGGINNTLPDISISDAELSDAANYQLDTRGQGWLTKRGGLTKVDATQRTATMYSIYYGRNGNYYHNGTVIYNLSGTSLATGIALAHDSWCSFGSYDIVVNGTDAKKTADGATFSTLANIPSGVKYVCSSNGFIYAAGHDKGKLRYCSYGLAEVWPPTCELALTQDENDDIVGLLPVKNGIAVFCTRSFYIINGWTDLDQQIAYYDKSIGGTGNRSLINTPFGIFFWSIDGLSWIKEGYTIDLPMRRKLAKTFLNVNKPYDPYVHGIWDKSQQRVILWLFNGATNTANLRMDYYPASDAFFLHTGLAANMSASGTIIILGGEWVLCGGYNPTYLYTVGGNTDDGTTITSYLETKREGNTAIRRTGWNVMLTTDLVTAENITYSAYVDNSATVSYSNTVATGTGLVDAVVSANLTNTRIKHRISDSAVTKTRIIQLTHTASQNMVR
jgi:hypothetical protein